MTPPRSSSLNDGSHALSARSRSLRSHLSLNSFSSRSTATGRDPLGIRRQRFGGQFSLRRGIAWSSSQGRELGEYNKWASPGNCLRRPAASNYLLSLVSETARTHGGSATGSWRQKGGERSLAEKWTPAALLSETGLLRKRSPQPPINLQGTSATGARFGNGRIPDLKIRVRGSRRGSRVQHCGYLCGPLLSSAIRLQHPPKCS